MLKAIKDGAEMELRDENMAAAFRSSGWEVVDMDHKISVKTVETVKTEVVNEPSERKLNREELEALSWNDFCEYAKSHGISAYGKRKIDVINKLLK
jgi:hypothetical protein